MRVKKIRGHKRRWKDIDFWIENNKNLDIEYLEHYQRDYTKIWIHPWSGLTLTNSKIPEPQKKTKIRILFGLFEIYNNWKQTLDNLGIEYYLKIWLFNPRFSKSQVVCAIGEDIDFYENAFFKPENERQIVSENYGEIAKVINEFQWEYRLDEWHFDNSDFGNPNLYTSILEFEEEKRYYTKKLNKPHRTTIFENPIGDATESYSYEMGTVWIGANSARQHAL
jgi:hypothetical protein